MSAFAGLFPGQLSEKAGMGEALARRHTYVADLFAEVSERSGVALAATFFGSGSPNLHADREAQVGVFAVSIAALDVLEREHGLSPVAVAGYSLGTYAAYVAAGALDRRAALDVLLEAERLLTAAKISGGMGFVIGLPKGEVEEIARSIAQEPEALAIGNENAAHQFVLTGDRDLVAKAIETAAPRALRAEMLPIAWPMHSRRLAGVAEGLSRFVRSSVAVSRPHRAVLFAPMLGRRVTDAREATRVLGEQLAWPSRWDAVLRGMGASGLVRYVEIGPGDVLTKMLRWTLRGAEGLVVEDPDSAASLLSAPLPPSRRAEARA